MRWRMPGVARRSPLSIWSMRASNWSVSDSTSRLVRGLFTLRRYDALAAGRGMHGLFSSVHENFTRLEDDRSQSDQSRDSNAGTDAAFCWRSVLDCRDSFKSDSAKRPAPPRCLVFRENPEPFKTLQIHNAISRI